MLDDKREEIIGTTINRANSSGSFAVGRGCANELHVGWAQTEAIKRIYEEHRIIFFDEGLAPDRGIKVR